MPRSSRPRPRPLLPGRRVQSAAPTQSGARSTLTLSLSLSLTLTLTLTRRTLNSADGKRGEGGPLLARLGPEATLALAEAAADLRALIKVKVADDQDLKTAQQAVAEAAHFFVALQQEAAGLGVSADEQLQHYVQ